MLIQQIIDTIFEDLSGIKAREHVLHLIHYNRVQASPGFREAADYIFNQLQHFGFENARLLQFPANGKINQWDWESPIAWRALDAELWLIEPHKEVLCDFKEIPMSLITHSQSTMTVADLVDVGSGLEEWQYHQDNIKDSIILATGSARDIYPMMIKHGVQGLIRYPSGERAYNYPDVIIADAFWPVDEDRDAVPFGFSISKRKAERLRSFLTEGKKVRLMANVNADLYDGDLDIVEAFIPCDDENGEEILMVAHLCNPKPSANDNASGSALLLEIARVLRKLKIAGKLPKNKRAIRFLWLPEYSGAIAWLHANYHRLDKIVACINLNSVGESPERIGTPLRVSTPPYSTASFLEDLVGSVADMVSKNGKYCSMEGSQRDFDVELETFSGISDHTIFIDKYFDIPSVMLGHEDPFMGTNLDTIENVDSTELLRVGLVATATACVLVSPDLSVARHLLFFQKAGSMNRINQYFKKALLNVYNAPLGDLDLRFYNEVGKASFLIKREEKNLESLLGYFDRKEFLDKVEEVRKSIKAYSVKEMRSMEKALRERGLEIGYSSNQMSTLPKEYQEAQMLIPQQLVDAPFKGLFKKVVFKRIRKSTKDWLRSNSLCKKGNVYGEIHNLINGENSIFDIFTAIELQFGNIKLADVRTYIMLMLEMKLVTIKVQRREKKKEAGEGTEARLMDTPPAQKDLMPEALGAAEERVAHVKPLTAEAGPALEEPLMSAQPARSEEPVVREITGSVMAPEAPPSAEEGGDVHVSAETAGAARTAGIVEIPAGAETALAAETPGAAEIPAGAETALAAETPGAAEIPAGAEIALAAETPGAAEIPAGAETALAAETPGAAEIPAGAETAVAAEAPEAAEIPAESEIAMAPETPEDAGIPEIAAEIPAMPEVLEHSGTAKAAEHLAKPRFIEFPVKPEVVEFPPKPDVIEVASKTETTETPSVSEASETPVASETPPVIETFRVPVAAESADAALLDRTYVAPVGHEGAHGEVDEEPAGLISTGEAVIQEGIEGTADPVPVAAGEGAVDERTEAALTPAEEQGPAVTEEIRDELMVPSSEAGAVPAPESVASAADSPDVMVVSDIPELEDQEAVPVPAGPDGSNEIVVVSDIPDLDDLDAMLDQYDTHEESPKPVTAASEEAPRPPDDAEISQAQDLIAVQELSPPRETIPSAVPEGREKKGTSHFPSLEKIEIDDFDIDSLELDLKKIVVKSNGDTEGELKDFIVDDINKLAFDLENSINMVLEETKKSMEALDAGRGAAEPEVAASNNDKSNNGSRDDEWNI
jgi:aminopeptidase-like protein